MTSSLVGVLNVLLGLVYTSYGLITLYELRRGWNERGPSHFGMAWVAMAFTCGPHHLDHGLHVLTSATRGGVLDLAVVLVGLPAGATWFLLRVEAVRGGAGDRPLGPLPAWVESLPTLGAVYAIATTTAILAVVGGGARFDPRTTPNLLLVVLYMAIGVVLLRTQLANNRILPGWSLSGLSLTVVFPTCALMHLVWVVYVATGTYVVDTHLLVIDVLGVPAAVYFLWVVWTLSTGRRTDWNSGARDAHGRGEESEEPVAATV